MNLELELTRLISASNAVDIAYCKMKEGRYAKSLVETHRIKMYDLKKQTKRAEDALKNKQTELFT